MNKHFFKAVLVSASLIFASIGHADAKRLGGARSFGKAPSAPMQKQAAPVQKPAQPAAAPAPAAAKPATPNRFGGILGGLAAGLGIGYLLSHFGLGEAAASMVTGLLIALLVGFAIMFVMRRMLPALSGAGKGNPMAQAGMQRANLDQNQRQEPAFTPAANAFGGIAAEPAPFQSTLPPGFDEYAFLDNAKQYFVSLQKAWDQGDMAALREYTTPEMFNTIEQDLSGRADSTNQTDVVTLNAQLLGIETADNTYYCSVQFSGMIREQVGAQANNFSEIWNLSKPVSGPGGWVLAGIQQLV